MKKISLWKLRTVLRKRREIDQIYSTADINSQVKYNLAILEAYISFNREEWENFKNS